VARRRPVNAAAAAAVPVEGRRGAVGEKGSFASRRERRPLKATRGSENERGQRGQGKVHGGTAAGTAGSRKDHGGAAFQAASACARRGEGASCIGKGRGDLGRHVGGSKTEGPAQARGRRAAASAGAAGALSARFCSECLCSK
jgi:hypothetical protein